MKDELTEEQAREILDALDEAINKGPWEESNFLRIFGKKLRGMRDDFASEMNRDQNAASAGMDAQKAHQELMQDKQRQIFIALYSSEGSNLQSWERILTNLARQVLSRPIYAEERDVQYFIKSKENRINEAYVAIYVNIEDILVLPSDKVLKDRFGKPLITLKDRAINVENISYFQHNESQYQYYRAHLIKRP